MSRRNRKPKNMGRDDEPGSVDGAGPASEPAQDAERVEGQAAAGDAGADDTTGADGGAGGDHAPETDAGSDAAEEGLSDAETPIPTNSDQSAEPLAGQDHQPATTTAEPQANQPDGRDPEGTAHPADAEGSRAASEKASGANGNGEQQSLSGEGGEGDSQRIPPPALLAGETELDDDGGLADELDDDAPEKPDHLHVPADYEVDALFAAGAPGDHANHFHDALAYTMLGLDMAASTSEPEPADEPLHVDVLAACAAGAMVFGTHEHDDTSLPVASYEYLSPPPIRLAAQCAADFVRGNPEAPAAVIPIHLKLKGHRPEKPVGSRELAAWTVFAAALQALDNMRAIDAANAEAEARTIEGQRRISASRDRLSFVPHDGALQPTGFSPSR